MYSFTYYQSGLNVPIGTFNTWEEFAALIVKECTLIHEESENNELNLMLSCWFIKLVAMGTVSDLSYQGLLDEEKMVYTYPDSNVVGRWEIAAL